MIAIVSAMRCPGIIKPDRLQVDERRVVDPHPEGLVGAVADGVRRVLAARALDRGVGPTRARPEQSRQLGHDRAVGHVVEALVDDPEALLDLVHAQQVARQAVALGPGRDVELELGEDAVRVRPADIEGDAGRPQVRAGHHHPQRGRGVDRAKPAHPADEDLVLVEKGVARIDLLGRLRHPVAQAAHELVVEVAVDPADPEVVEEHPLAGQGGQHVDDLVTLDERPQDRRQPAEVERHPAEEERVAGDPVELGREDPDVLGPARDLDVHQLLEGEDRGPLVEQRADVLERVRVADRLVVVRVLAQLLDAAMEIAEHRVEVDDLFAVELQDDAEDAMGRWMLRAHVDEHLAVAERVELGFPLRPRRVRGDGLEDANVAVERDPGVVRGLVGGADGHRSRSGSVRPASGARAPSWGRCSGCACAPSA